MRKNNTKSFFPHTVIVICIILGILLVARIVTRIVNNEKALENFVIAELSNEEIVKEENVCREFMFKIRSHGSSSGFLNEMYDAQDHEEVNYSVKKITGINTISATLAEGRTVTLDINVKLLSGVAKLAIVADDRILECIELDGETTLEYTVNGANKVFVKMLCEDAKIEAVVIRSIASSQE